MKQLAVFGCSHTVGLGLEMKQRYATVVADQLGMEQVNQGVPGASASIVQQNLVEYLQTYSPQQIIFQWPNPIRLNVWHGHRRKMETHGHHGEVFEAMLMSGENNFIEPWTQTIIVCNLLCRALKIPALNICLQTVDAKVHAKLQEYSIVLHQDNWLLEPMASDGVHHSAQCHAQWADRILTLLKENSP